MAQGRKTAGMFHQDMFDVPSKICMFVFIYFVLKINQKKESNHHNKELCCHLHTIMSNGWT